MSEARQIIGARGEKMDVSGMDRDSLIKLIVEKVGFKGFLEELSLLIKKEAIEGLIAQAETWSQSKKENPGKGIPAIKGSIEDWASLVVQQQMDKGQIDISKDIVAGKQPMYGMRTYSASPLAELKKYEDKFGKVITPKESLTGIDEAEISKYDLNYKKSKATAVNIQQEQPRQIFSQWGERFRRVAALNRIWPNQRKNEQRGTAISAHYPSDYSNG
jgi:hypothetical protein